MIQARLPEWLWRGQAIAAARARIAATEALRDARERARAALELAERAREPSEPFAPGPDPVRACELYREAEHWALVALRRPERPTAADAAAFSSAGTPRTPSSAERSHSAAEAAQLAAGARALVAEACSEETALQRLRSQRCWRMGLFLVLLGFGMFRAILLLRDGIDLRPDLARGKPWRLSSEALRCDPVQRRCGDYLGMSIFFHTAVEPSPWFELDLQQQQEVSAVRVRNRTDCCSELAVPLVLELSQDQHTWREVARRNRNFRNWKAAFEPSLARWIRLRVDRPSALHLERVSVYR